MGFTIRLVLGVAAVGLAACGGGGGGGAASCNPGPTASMSFTSAGLSPANACVSPGGIVTFTNNDLVSHHPEFDSPASCPTVPELAPGATQQIPFANTFNCTFHDGDNPAAVFSGTVAVTSVTVTGGY